jgi:hypothetical protein
MLAQTRVSRLRDRAEEIRTRAVSMNNAAARATMLAIAHGYDRLADHLENQNQGGTKGGLPQSG